MDVRQSHHTLYSERTGEGNRNMVESSLILDMARKITRKEKRWPYYVNNIMIIHVSLGACSCKMGNTQAEADWASGGCNHKTTSHSAKLGSDQVVDQT